MQPFHQHGDGSRNDDAVAYFRDRVSTWARAHKRQFPWRDTDDPFAILIAEIMLRRTRAEQVIPVYQRFRARFPTPSALAGADPEAVAEIVRPLGLTWRVPAFQALGRVLRDAMHGQVPEARSELQEFSGVGDYVAAAVRIFAFNRPDTLVDTNTVRVAGRYFGFAYHPESRRNRLVRMAIDRLHDHAQPRESGEALLDFAALVCQATTPHCEACPVSGRCVYFVSQKVSSVGGS